MEELPVSDAGCIEHPPLNERAAQTSDPFGWRDADSASLSRCHLILGADLIYAARATDALVTLLPSLLKRLAPGAVAILALERRLNFSVHSLSVRAPAADHFAQRLAESELIHAERIDLERVPQRFDYERTRELELWEVRLHG